MREKKSKVLDVKAGKSHWQMDFQIDCASPVPFYSHNKLVARTEMSRANISRKISPERN